MNHGAIAVIVLAIGAIILIGLGYLYSKGTNGLGHDIFTKIDSDVDSWSIPTPGGQGSGNGGNHGGHP